MASKTALSTIQQIKHIWPLAPWGALGYGPNPAQQPIIDAAERFLGICGGVRSGKSYTTSALFLKKCLIPDSIFWISSVDYVQARKEFSYIHKALTKLGLLSGSASMPRVGAWHMDTVWGAHIETKTTADTMKIASEALDGFLLCEAGQNVEEAWLAHRDRVSEKKGWGILSGTLEHTLEWWPDLLDRWAAANDQDGRSFLLPTWTNRHDFPGGETDPEILSLKATMSVERFDMRYGAKRQKPAGVVFPGFDMATHVIDFEIDDDAPIEIATDPATHTYPVLFVQRVGNVVYVLDEVYRHGVIAQDIIPEVMDHPLWPRVIGGVMDIAGKQRHGNISQQKIWLDETGLSLRSQKIPEEVTRDQITLRLQNDPTLGHPLLFFSSKLQMRRTGNLADGILAETSLWRWPERAPSRNEARLPINRNNDGLKALGYYLVDQFGTGREEQRKGARGQRTKGFPRRNGRLGGGLTRARSVRRGRAVR